MCKGESSLKAGPRLNTEVTYLCSPIYTGRCVSLSLEQFYFLPKMFWQLCVEGQVFFQICCNELCLYRGKNSVLLRGITLVCVHIHTYLQLSILFSLFFPVCFNSPQCLIFCTLSAALISLISLSFLSMTAPRNPHSLINLLLSRIRNHGLVFLCPKTHT